MKRYLLGSLVGAVLLFGWQAVAHMGMHHHDAAYKTVPDQENVIDMFPGIFQEEGQYIFPQADMKAPYAEQAKFQKALEGKPWAQVVYHPAYKSDMGMSALRSFVTAFVCLLIFIWILGKNPGNLWTVSLKGLALGFLMFMFVWYNNNIWMQTPWSVISGELIDLLVGWGLCGLWLGWWLNRKGNNGINYNR